MSLQNKEVFGDVRNPTLPLPRCSNKSTNALHYIIFMTIRQQIRIFFVFTDQKNFIHATLQNEKKSPGQLVFPAGHVHCTCRELHDNCTTGELTRSSRSLPFQTTRTSRIWHLRYLCAAGSASAPPSPPPFHFGAQWPRLPSTKHLRSSA